MSGDEVLGGQVALVALVTQEPNSFISEVQMRPTRKPQSSAVR